MMERTFSGAAVVASAVASAGAVWWMMNVIAKKYLALRQSQLDLSGRSLEAMFIFVEPRHLWNLGLALALVSAPLFASILGLPLGVAVATGALWVPSAVVRVLKQRRRRALEAQLPGMLRSVAGALRAGGSFVQALERVASDAAAPLGQELRLWCSEVRLGLGVDEAWSNLARRAQSQEVEQIVSAVLIAKAVGGNGSELLEALAEAIRERLELRSRILSLTAQGRMQGWVLAAMPGVIGCALHALRPDLTLPLLRHPFGWLLLGSTLGLMLAGLLWIRRLVDAEL